ncbi:MAG: phosphatase PAP2 family protein [Bacteroides sp.]|nr:phosphatase PAP2 family protein [Bacteroides sp.]
MAFFSALYFRNRMYSVLIFLWAFAVAYSRIYVGKHYPLDVATGIAFGFLTGWFAWWCYKQYGVPKESPLEEEREERIL